MFRFDPSRFRINKNNNYINRNTLTLGEKKLIHHYYELLFNDGKYATPSNFVVYTRRKKKTKKEKNRMKVKIPMENGNGTMARSPWMFECEKDVVKNEAKSRKKKPRLNKTGSKRFLKKSIWQLNDSNPSPSSIRNHCRHVKYNFPMAKRSAHIISNIFNSFSSLLYCGYCWTFFLSSFIYLLRTSHHSKKEARGSQIDEYVA